MLVKDFLERRVGIREEKDRRRAKDWRGN